MRRNRWQQVEELYHSVLERPQDERAAFLTERCADDPDLLREVEELLSYDGAAESFIEKNALVVAAQQFEPADLRAINEKSLIGERIGVYKILAPLGRGGMGEVYRAHDERLSRDVAIKIIPAEFSRDADRLRRFEREARATSALNHPNILTVYDIATHDGVPCIVAELLEGEELRAQLKQGPLSVRKAIEYGQQITSGLAAAHEKGITHRDLKPANLFVTKDGRVKILDFGLAKLKPATLPGEADSEASTREPQTDPGTVMGTVGYMSPEQVRGLGADHRADIFSFGVILYEMLTGRQAFLRETTTDTNIAVLSEDPEEVTDVNNKVPPELGRIVRRCLEKKPERRFHSAYDLGFALEALSTPPEVRLEIDTASTENASNLGLLKRETWMWIAATALVALTAFGLAGYFVRRPPAEARLMKLEILPLEKSGFDHVAISPDARWLAFTAATGAKVQLWVRALDATEATALPGTEDARLPFWSPDSQHLGFFAGSKLKKIEVPGGVPVTLCDVRSGTGGAWNRDGVILFSSLAGVGISQISATGGEVTSVIRADVKRGETDYKDPSFLPDGRHFLYFSSSGQKEIRGVYVASLDGRVNQRLLSDDSNAVYAASSSGGEYLLFVREGALMAQPFDARELRLTGEPFSIAREVGRILGTAVRRNFSVSENGVLVLDPLPNRQRNQLIWLDRKGKRTNHPGGRWGSTRSRCLGCRLTISASFIACLKSTRE